MCFEDNQYISSNVVFEIQRIFLYHLTPSDLGFYDQPQSGGLIIPPT